MNTTARSTRPSQRALALLAAGVFLLLTVAGVAIISRIDAPDYGAWTGIRPLETKLKMLEQFASQGQVDALIVGSSITEFGFSARVFSELMSKKLGRDYRAFNFATGGAELRTLPKLYRIARSVARPKTVFLVVPPEPKLPEKDAAQSPDYVLLNAPVGPMLEHPGMLDLSRVIWNTPVLRNSPALRDRAMFGYYRNLAQAVGLESYAVDANGDRVSYLMTWKAADLPLVRRSAEAAVAPFTDTRADAASREDRILATYFARTDIAAMQELKTLVERDGGKLHVISHAGAATLWGGPPTDDAVVRARRDFFDAMTRKLGADFWDALAVARVPEYAVSDVTHLNVYGAELFTRIAFAVGTGGPLPEPHAASAREEVPPLNMFPTQDPTFNPVSALVFRPAGEAHPLLKFRTVVSLAVPPLPREDLFVALRMPDNRDVVAPVVALGPGDFVAEVGLAPAANPQGIVVRLLHGAGPAKTALSAPLEDYEWLRSYPNTPLRVQAGGDARLLALPPARAPGESVYVAMKAGNTEPARVGVRLVPRQGTALDLGRASVVAQELVQARLPATIALGEYAVQAYDSATGAALGEAPLRIEPLPPPFKEPSLRVVGAPSAAEGGVKVAWSDIHKPDPTDWIGLFRAGAAKEGRIDLRYTRGQAAGELIFPMSPALGAGEYELRLFAAGGWRELAATHPFTFGTPPPPASAPALPAPARPAPPAPASAAAPQPKVAAPPAAGPWIEADSSPRISAGSTKVKWHGVKPAGTGDWIGLFPWDGKPEDRIDFIQTGGQATGEAHFPLSAAHAQRIGPGDYEFRLYNATWKLLARTDRIRFNREPAADPKAAAGPAARLSVNPKVPLGRKFVNVRWTILGKGSPDDWIGLYAAGATAHERLDFVWTQAKAEGVMEFPIHRDLLEKLKSGKYEFRLYTGWTPLARSEPFVFTSDP